MNIKKAIMSGIILLVIVFVIEIPVMVYGFAADMGWNYFMTWHIILGYILTVIIPILAAYKIK